MRALSSDPLSHMITIDSSPQQELNYWTELKSWQSGIKVQSPDLLNHKTSTVSSFPQGGELLYGIRKHWEQQAKLLHPSVLPQPRQNSLFCLLSWLSDTFGVDTKAWTLTAWGHKLWGECGGNGNLPSPQVVKLPAAPSTQKEGSFYNERSPARDNWPLYKKLQLVSLDHKCAGDQVWWSEYMGKCLASELQPPSQW
jgi:hypothetical protein